MGLIPSECDKADEARLAEEAKKRVPKVGDLVFITIRGKIITLSKSMTQIELSELHEAGVISDPIFMWMPTDSVTPHQLGTPA
jgi:hypothetical protein